MCSITASDAASQASTGSKLDSAMENAVRSTLPESAAPAAKLEAKSTTANVRANLTASPEGEGPSAPVRRPRYNPNIRKLFDGDETWAKATFELAAARSSTAATAKNGRISRNRGRSADRTACVRARVSDCALKGAAVEMKRLSGGNLRAARYDERN